MPEALTSAACAQQFSSSLIATHSGAEAAEREAAQWGNGVDHPAFAAKAGKLRMKRSVSPMNPTHSMEVPGL